MKKNKLTVPISEDYPSEAALLKKKQDELIILQSSAMKSSIDGMALLDPEGNYFFINEAHASIYGYDSADELIGKSWEILYDPDELARFRNIIMPDLVKAGKWRGEAIGMKKDRSKFHQELSLGFIEGGGIVCVVRDISERKATEEQLRNVINAIPDGIIFINSVYRIMFASPETLKLFRILSEFEIIGHSILEWVHPDDHDHVINAITKLHNGTLCSPNTYRFSTSDHSEFWGEVTSSIMHNEQGNPNGYITVIRDVTDRVLNDMELQDSEERYRHLVEFSPDAIAVHVEGILVFANQAAMRLVGASAASEIIGKPIFDFVHPESRQIAAARIRKVLTTGSPEEMIEEKFLRIDGSVIDTEVVSIPIRYGTKQAGLVIVHDITRKKRTEQAFRESEERYKRLINGMFEGLLVVDNDDIIQFINPKFCSMIGYSPDELIGKVGHEILLSPEDSEMIIEKNKQRLAGKSEKYELRMITKGGGSILLSMSASPMIDANGTVIGSMAVCLDITDQKKAEEQIQKLNSELEGQVTRRTRELHETQKELESFSIAVAQHFQPPLKAIDGFSKQVMEDYAHLLDHQGNNMLSMIRIHTQKIVQLIDEMQNISGEGRVDVQNQDLKMKK